MEFLYSPNSNYAVVMTKSRGRPFKGKRGQEKPKNDVKTSAAPSSKNPFEVKFNREKESVLGRRPNHMVQGKPGVSKRRAVDKRMKTLLNEFKGTRRTGVFDDTRLGESDAKLSVDEKMFLRYAAERRKTFEKKASSAGKSNGAEDALTITERQQRSKKSNDYSYGGMSERAVAEVHFGQGGDGNARGDWRDRLDQLISDSKKAKYEKHAERYHTFDLVDELDADWSALRGDILAAGAPLPPVPPSEVPEQRDTDLFDTVVAELRYEQCPDHHKILDDQRLKAAAERKRQRFEEDTEAKMTLHVTDGKRGIPHISADALEEDVASIIKQAAKQKKNNNKRNLSSVGTSEPPSIQIDKKGVDLSDVLDLSLSAAIQHLIVKFNPELHPGNKGKLLAHVNQYLRLMFGATSTKSTASLLSEANEALNVLFDLTRTYTAFLEVTFRAILSSYFRIFCLPETDAITSDQIGRCFCFLKLLVGIFPTSDAFHTVMSPAFSLLAAALRYLAARVTMPSLQAEDLLQTVCLSVAFMDLGVGFVLRSRRYVPEIILCFVHSFHALFGVSHQTNTNNKKCPLAVMSCQHDKPYYMDRLITLAGFLCDLWADTPGSKVFLDDIVHSLKSVADSSTLPKPLLAKAKEILDKFAKSAKKAMFFMKVNKTLKTQQVQEEPAVQALASFLPVVSSEDRTGRKKKETAAAKTTRLRRQIKKEERHAIRELRRDNEFLARHSLTERIAVDEERDRKTKRIIGQLAMQEGECRKFGGNKTRGKTA